MFTLNVSDLGCFEGHPTQNSGLFAGGPAPKGSRFGACRVEMTTSRVVADQISAARGIGDSLTLRRLLAGERMEDIRKDAKKNGNQKEQKLLSKNKGGVFLATGGAVDDEIDDGMGLGGNMRNVGFRAGFGIWGDFLMAFREEF